MIFSISLEFFIGLCFYFNVSKISLSFSDQLLYPFKVLDRVNLFDIDVVYDGIGFTAQAIATRLAISKALCSFISSKEVEYLRLGLKCYFRSDHHYHEIFLRFSWTFD